MDWLKDSRTNSWSITVTLPSEQYLELVRPAHENQGNIQGQRPVQSTASARRIRQRLVSDLRDGAILPPVVIGLVLDQNEFDRTFPIIASAKSTYVQTQDGIDDVLALAKKSDLSIIDGMQRTAAMMEARRDEVTRDYPPVRVEFWIAHAVAPLVYRMLILNTGQLPWTIARQITVIHAPLLKEVKDRVTSITRVLGDNERRARGGEYSEKNISELYMAFTLRKHTFETKERVAEEFSRLDFIEVLGDPESQDIFYQCLDLLARFDLALSRYTPTQTLGKIEEDEAVDKVSKILRGRFVFDSEPARIGFIVALAVDILGRPGGRRKDPKITLAERASQLSSLIERIDKMNEEELGEFLDLPLLSENLGSAPGGQIGRTARNFFFEGFSVLLKEDCDPETLAVCWRAYN